MRFREAKLGWLRRRESIPGRGKSVCKRPGGKRQCGGFKSQKSFRIILRGPVAGSPCSRGHVPLEGSPPIVASGFPHPQISGVVELRGTRYGPSTQLRISFYPLQMVPEGKMLGHLSRVQVGRKVFHSFIHSANTKCLLCDSLHAG